MKLLPINVSLASFQMQEVELLYLDPYNNTLGEANGFIVFMVFIICICSICVIFASCGVVMFEKYGLNPDNRKLLDMLISFGMIIGIMTVVVTTILTVHRNIFGPLQNQNLVVGLLSIKMFGKLCLMMVIIEAYFVWYVTEIVLKSQCEMDAVGMAECFNFFTVVLSAGMTFLASNVGYIHHQNRIKYIGLPLDFSEKYLIRTR